MHKIRLQYVLKRHEQVKKCKYKNNILSFDPEFPSRSAEVKVPSSSTIVIPGARIRLSTNISGSSTLSLSGLHQTNNTVSQSVNERSQIINISMPS
jgi:hypothetical protein